MATRTFFKAHLGGKTWMRGTESSGPPFLSFGFAAHMSPSWSRKPPGFGSVPAIPITEAEFISLKALHAARIIALGKLPGHYSAPAFAWVEGEI